MSLSPADALALLRSKACKTLLDPITRAYTPFVPPLLLREVIEPADADTTADDGGVVGMFDATVSRKTPVSFTDLWSMSSRRVNITGPPGGGKTALLLGVGDVWGTQSGLTSYSLVIYVNVPNLTLERYPTGEPVDEVALIVREGLGLHQTPQLRDAVSRLYHPSSTLWLIDGYEFVGRVPPHMTPLLTSICAADRLLAGALPSSSLCVSVMCVYVISCMYVVCVKVVRTRCNSQACLVISCWKWLASPTLPSPHTLPTSSDKQKHRRYRQPPPSRSLRITH